eukprot:GSMAST32.ASY1.ANO1.1508.1 assembled CDS
MTNATKRKYSSETGSGSSKKCRLADLKQKGFVNYSSTGCLQQRKGGGTIELPAIDWSKRTLTDFRRDFYTEHSKVAKLSESEVTSLRAKMNLTVTEHGSPGCVPAPVKGFKRSSLPRVYVEKLLSLGYKAPTSIQSQSWPVTLQGKNVVGLAQTGSGKTAAFLLPAMIHVQAQMKVKSSKQGDTGPIALILVPTRELAVQIKEEAMKLTPKKYVHSLRSCLLYGGANKAPQIRSMQRGAEIVIATPGRLLDLMNRNIFNLVC